MQEFSGEPHKNPKKDAEAREENRREQPGYSLAESDSKLADERVSLHREHAESLENDAEKIRKLGEMAGIDVTESLKKKQEEVSDVCGVSAEKAMNALKEAGLLREFDLSMRTSMKHVENMRDSVNHLNRIVADMQHSRSMLRIGKNLEQSQSFDEIKKQSRMLFEDMNTMQRFSIDKLATTPVFRQYEAKIHQLASNMEKFYYSISTLRQKVSNFHEGRSNDDEDVLRNFQNQLRIAFDHLKELRSTYFRQGRSILEYQKGRNK